MELAGQLGVGGGGLGALKVEEGTRVEGEVVPLLGRGAVWGMLPSFQWPCASLSQRRSFSVSIVCTLVDTFM